MNVESHAVNETKYCKELLNKTELCKWSQIYIVIYFEISFHNVNDF